MPGLLPKVALLAGLLVPSGVQAQAPELELRVVDQAGTTIDERVVTTVQAHLHMQPFSVTVSRGPSATPDDWVAQAQEQLAESDQLGIMWVQTIPAHKQQPGALRFYLYTRGAQGLRGREIAMPSGQTSASLESLANVVTAVSGALIEQSRQALAAEARAEAAVEADAAGGLVGEELGLLPVSKTGEILTAGEEGDTKPTDDADAGKQDADTSDRAKAGEREADEPEATESEGPRTPEEPKPAVKGRPRLQLSLGYVGNTFAPEILWQSGLGLGLGYLLTKNSYLGLGYELVLPSRVLGPGVRVELRRHPVIVEGGYRLGLGPAKRWDFSAGARLSVDPIVRVANPQGPQMVMINPREVRVFASVAPVFGVGYRPVSQVRLSINLGLDLVLRRAQYRAYTPAPEILIFPHPIRFLAGFRLDFMILRPPKKN